MVKKIQKIVEKFQNQLHGNPVINMTFTEKEVILTLRWNILNHHSYIYQQVFEIKELQKLKIFNSEMSKNLAEFYNGVYKEKVLNYDYETN